MKEKAIISGEHAAISGYGFQYSIFAREIYNVLLDREDRMDWIEFASTDAGKVDDVLIGLDDSVLAFQVKKLTDPFMSYNDFVAGEPGSIFSGMFEGWQRLAVSNPRKKIIVRFITTQSSSRHDQIQLYGGSNKASFTDFINDFWKRVSEGGFDKNTLPKVWHKVFAELSKKVNANQEDLIHFIQSTEFVFNYQTPKLQDVYAERQRNIDIENISAHIFTTISKKGTTRYTRQQFLKEFGFQDRHQTYYNHSFFVDDLHYQPLESTISTLDSLIISKKKGYLALVGNAGSGKSTLLTKWIQQSNYKVLKFYAYVNTEMTYEFGYRGEAKVFLHDLLIQMRQSGLDLGRLPSDDLTDLQKHFNSELNDLSREEQPVIIVVDGLDHIEREQSVKRSLLDILPIPDSVPDNIFFFTWISNR